jgi:replicative DNA helicase
MLEKNFGKMGLTYQLNLIKSIIEDKRFGAEIIEHLDPKYFDNASLKYVITVIKEFYTNFNDISNYERIEQKIHVDHSDVENAKVLIDTVSSIKEIKEIDPWVQKTSLNFCRQEHLKRELKKVESIIDSQSFEEYDRIQDIVSQALQVGGSDITTMSIDFNVEETISDDQRNPITTGINGFDNLLSGGLGRGEVGVILAPTGVGKTTILTKFANAAYIDGHNVLQVFFEDGENDVKRKHYTLFTGVPPREQVKYKDSVVQKIREVTSNCSGRLELLRLPSGTVTVSSLKNRIRKLISTGFKIDMLILDYIECLVSDNSTDGEDWKGEGAIMRQLDAMASELNMAIWMGTQGNRESIGAEIVQGNHVGGSMKKIQIAHVVVTIAKTNEQKEGKLATITFMKSRLGPDGVVFRDCTFNNEELIIDTTEQNSLLGFRQQQIENNRMRVQNGYQIGRVLNNN